MSIEKSTYPYPKECFQAETTLTQIAKRDYEIKYDNFYAEVEKQYPDYYKKGLREQMEIRNTISAQLGYRI